jgi:hypothetical protein
MANVRTAPMVSPAACSRPCAGYDRGTSVIMIENPINWWTLASLATLRSGCFTPYAPVDTAGDSSTTSRMIPGRASTEIPDGTTGSPDTTEPST